MQKSDNCIENLVIKAQSSNLDEQYAAVQALRFTSSPCSTCSSCASSHFPTSLTGKFFQRIKNLPSMRLLSEWSMWSLPFILHHPFFLLRLFSLPPSPPPLSLSLLQSWCYSCACWLSSERQVKKRVHVCLVLCECHFNKMRYWVRTFFPPSHPSPTILTHSFLPVSLLQSLPSV